MHNSGFTYHGGRILTCDALQAAGLVHHGFSAKKNGTSSGVFTSLNLGVYTRDDAGAVEKNFSLFCEEAGVDVRALRSLHQVHSAKLITIAKAQTAEAEQTALSFPPQNLPEADGLMTNLPGVPLAVFYADCTPVLLLDPVQRVVAAVHSGWRGTVQKIAQRAVLAMHRQFGTKAEDVLVAMGPSIKQCHFEVDEDVYLEFLLHFGSAAEQFSVFRNGKYYIDTDALNVHSLLQTGVCEEHISVCPLCTYCEKDLFYSYRRDGETGRMCAIIELTV